MPAGLALDNDARSVVDYALARRSVLHALASGRASEVEVCDAQPYLLRAARFHGEPSDERCPVCRTRELTLVRYTYGDCFGEGVNGRARAAAELDELAGKYAEFTVFVVEVCTGCRWNHLLTSYVLGRGQLTRRRRARTRA